jgi:cytochrome c-type biogenesis protein CcmH/NrfG
MTLRDASVMVTVAVMVTAAIFGGAFFPGPRIVVGLLLACSLGVAVGSTWSRFAAEEWLSLGFVSWAIVAATAAAAAPLAARETVVVWIVTGGLFFVARRVAVRTARMSLAVVSMGGAIVALGVVCEAMGFGGIRVGGLLENPNVAASLLIVSLPALLIGEGGPGWRIAAGAIIALGLVLTGSRAGLLALLVSAAFILPRGRLRFAGLLAGTLGFGAVLVWRFLSHPDVLAWFRPAIWSAVLRLWSIHPLLGVGPGGLVDAAGVVRLLHADHVGRHQFLISYAESTPLALLVQTGAVGLVIAAAVVLAWWRGLRRRQGFSRPFVAVLVAMAVMGAFHDLLTVDVVLWWWALCIGLMEAESGSAATDFGKSGEGGRRALTAIVFAFIVLFGMVQPAWARWLWRSAEPSVVLMARSTRAEPWFDAPLEWRVRDLLKRPSWNWISAAEAISCGERAVRIHPGAARLWTVLGMAHTRVVTDLGPWPDSVTGARQAFARAVELEPLQPWAWLEWARHERNLGHTSDAVELVRRALEAEPHTVRARLFLARLELDRGDQDAAREAYLEALRSARLRARSGLSSYERELLDAPAWQFREIGQAVQ